MYIVAVRVSLCILNFAVFFQVKYDDGSAYENLPQGFPQLIQKG